MKCTVRTLLAVHWRLSFLGRATNQKTVFWSRITHRATVVRTVDAILFSSLLARLFKQIFFSLYYNIIIIWLVHFPKGLIKFVSTFKTWQTFLLTPSNSWMRSEFYVGIKSFMKFQVRDLVVFEIELYKLGLFDIVFTLFS